MTAPWDRTSKSSHDSDGLSISRSLKERYVLRLETISSDVFHFEKRRFYATLGATSIKCRSMKLPVSLIGNSFVNFRPEVLFEAALCWQNIEKILKNCVVLDKYKNTYIIIFNKLLRYI